MRFRVSFTAADNDGNQGVTMRKWTDYVEKAISREIDADNVLVIDPGSYAIKVAVYH